jgi:hypothetical protein
MSWELYPATEKQISYIRKLASDLALSAAKLDDLIRRVTAGRAVDPLSLDKRDASRVIDRLKREGDAAREGIPCTAAYRRQESAR